MLLRSPAKVNLYLRVGPRRPDGFHSLVSWFCSVGLEDTLEFSPNPSGAVTMSCDLPGVPCDERNLIIRAAQAISDLCPGHPGLHIRLQKRIPMGGGLGGGSSNAALTLRALLMLWRCSLPVSRLNDLAAQLGSDVPFFLHLPSAICRGRGEQITRIAPPVSKAVLLILPPIEMPTPMVYRQFDQMCLGADLETVEHALPDPSLPTADLLSVLVNDLEAPAFAISSQLADLRTQCQHALGRPVRMSGSGSTLFTLYDEIEQAHSAAGVIENQLRTKAIACPLGVLP